MGRHKKKSSSSSSSNDKKRRYVGLVIQDVVAPCTTIGKLETPPRFDNTLYYRCAEQYPPCPPPPSPIACSAPVPCLPPLPNNCCGTLLCQPPLPTPPVVVPCCPPTPICPPISWNRWPECPLNICEAKRFIFSIAVWKCTPFCQGDETPVFNAIAAKEGTLVNILLSGGLLSCKKTEGGCWIALPCTLPEPLRPIFTVKFDIKDLFIEGKVADGYILLNPDGSVEFQPDFDKCWPDSECGKYGFCIDDTISLTYQVGPFITC